MSKGFDIKWEGINELNDVFKTAKKQIGSEADKILKSNNKRMASRIRSAAPYDTGFLLANIAEQYNGNQAYVVSGAPYSGFVEFGTSKMAAQPYMRLGLWEQAPIFEKELLEAMEGLFR